jgi:hypothetical protein
MRSKELSYHQCSEKSATKSWQSVSSRDHCSAGQGFGLASWSGIQWSITNDGQRVEGYKTTMFRGN